MPKFLLPSLAEALQQGRPQRLLTLAVAGWMRYLRGVDEAGREIPIADRLAGELRALANEGRDDPRPMLGLSNVFGELARDQPFVSELAAALRELDAGAARRRRYQRTCSKSNKLGSTETHHKGHKGHKEI